MITHLRVEGLAIIDKLSIDFTPGFNVITGETGAGKSILIKALQFLLGGKFSVDSIRQGAGSAMVSANFDLPNGHELLVMLSNAGIENDGEVIVRRLLGTSGRAQSWINDISVTNQFLKEAGGLLIDIFGQHENQRLMRTERHGHYVDLFLPKKSVKGDFQKAYQKVAAEERELRELLRSAESSLKERDFMQFRYEELEKLSPSAKDFEELETFCKEAEGGAEKRASLQQVAEILDSDRGNVSNHLWEVAKILKKAGLEEQSKKAESLASGIEDLSFSTSQEGSSLESDEGKLEASQERLFKYQESFRRMAVKNVSALVEAMEKLKESLAFLENTEAILNEKCNELLSGVREALGLAKELSVERKRAAREIEKNIGKELQDLEMKGARFEVRWNEIDRAIQDVVLGYEKSEKSWSEAKKVLRGLSEQGSETAEFMLASNVGENFLPLSNVASGGELSRIMLALKKALVADAETCILVFDEIDSGISGKVADVVGKKIKELSKRFQVICISHLPQVAVYNDSHYLVKKEGKKARTETSIVRLTLAESVREVARLLSGAEISEKSIENAEVLIARAKEVSGRKTQGVQGARLRS